MKLHIERLSRNQYISKKTGKPYTKVGVRAGGEWYSAYADGWNEDWKEGDSIEVEIEENRVGDKVYKNIKPPTIAEVKDALNARFAALEDRVALLERGDSVVEAPEHEVPPHTDADMPPEFQ